MLGEDVDVECLAWMFGDLFRLDVLACKSCFSFRRGVTYGEAAEKSEDGERLTLDS